MNAIDTIYTVALPRLAGSREQAERLTDHLPDDLSDSTVVIDAREAASIAQCCIDELCKQIAQRRKAKKLVVVTDNGRLVQRVLNSARLRSFEDRVVIVATEDFAV